MSKPYIVAEMSANHGHDIEIAKRTILAAKECGADAVKLQTYTPDTLTIDCDNEFFRLGSSTNWEGVKLYDLYSEAFTPWEWHHELYKYANDIGITIFSTPFDISAVDFLESLDNPIYKVASFEIVDLPLIEYIASKNKPIIISCGIATFDEILDAVKVCRSVGNMDITLLQCTSSYPAKLEDANILTMNNMKETFDVKVGLSDHSLGNVASIVATSLGAQIIERHFILDKFIGGPDASFSLDVNEFKLFVQSVTDSYKALGKVDYDFSVGKKTNRKFARSIFVVQDILKGEKFSAKNIRSIRPGDGLKPKYYKSIIGKNALEDINRGTPLKSKFIEGFDIDET